MFKCFKVKKRSQIIEINEMKIKKWKTINLFAYVL